MRGLLSLFRRRRRRPVRPPNAGWYRSASCRSLTANQIRERRFAGARRGLDPAEVYAFLCQVAGELAVTRRELILVREENARIKGALRRWQSRFSPGVRW